MLENRTAWKQKLHCGTCALLQRRLLERDQLTGGNRGAF